MLQAYNIWADCTFHLSLHLYGGASCPELLDPKFLDSRFNLDLTNSSDSTIRFRGKGFKYIRPNGWIRFGLKVTGQYESDSWLGSVGPRIVADDQEWPVSYHGTAHTNVLSIVTEGYRLTSRGIYSSPWPDVAASYAREFEWQAIRWQSMLQATTAPSSSDPLHLLVIFPASSKPQVGFSCQHTRFA